MRTLSGLTLALAISAATAPAAADSGIHPIVHGGSRILLGAAIEDRWLTAEETSPRLRGGERYRHYSLLHQHGASEGSAPISAGDPCPETMLVETVTPEGFDTVSVAGEWNALVRIPKRLDPGLPVYRKAAADWLTGRGLETPAAELEQVIRVDLEGDGVDEVLLAANHRVARQDGDISHAMSGDYSFVLLRRLKEGKVETLALADVIHVSPSPGDINYWYGIAAILDLNGDGVMEIIVKNGYYEGEGVAVFAVEAGKPKLIFDEGCGA
ncbi:MAG: VCBS repeat-containing protein [Alphaproteobacteria bacterium]|nr:VCBS repeat-containing protein [Alphaproteobacteria bacterium]